MADDPGCAPEQSRNSEEDDLPTESPEDANESRADNPEEGSTKSGCDMNAPRRYRIDRELLAGIMTEVDPSWVEEETNFASVTGYSMIEFAGLLNCLNASCVSARDYPYYAPKEALWERHAEDFRKLEGEIDAGFFLAAARLGLDQSGFAQLVLKATGAGTLAEVSKRLENCYNMLDCPIAKECEESAKLIKFDGKRAARAQSAPAANDFSIYGVTQKSLIAVVADVDPLMKGQDAPDYVEGMSRLCAYLKIKVDEDALPFKKDDILMVMWRANTVLNDKLLHNPHLRKRGGSSRYEEQELFDLFAVIERIKDKDYDLLCMENRITVPLPALYQRPTAGSLARAYMILAGHDVLRSSGESHYLWYNGVQWWTIWANDRIVAQCWEAFRQSVPKVLLEGAARQKIDCEKAALHLNSTPFVKQIFDNCKRLILPTLISKAVELEHLQEQVRRFVKAECQILKDAKVLSGELFSAYLDFCRSRGEIEEYPSATAFLRNLNRQLDLFASRRSNGKRFTVGLRLMKASQDVSCT